MYLTDIKKDKRYYISYNEPIKKEVGKGLIMHKKEEKRWKESMIKGVFYRKSLEYSGIIEVWAFEDAETLYEESYQRLFKEKGLIVFDEPEVHRLMVQKQHTEFWQTLNGLHFLFHKRKICEETMQLLKDSFYQKMLKTVKAVQKSNLE